MHIRFFAAAMLLIVAGSVTADEDKSKVLEKPVAADTPEKFAITAQQIRDNMNPDGRYEFVRPDEKAKIETDLVTIAGMLQKSGSVAAMSEPEKVNLFNTQEHLNGVLTHNDRNRLVCERRAPVGTWIPITTCKTLGEVEANRRATQRMVFEAGTVGDVCANPQACKKEPPKH